MPEVLPVPPAIVRKRIAYTRAAAVLLAAPFFIQSPRWTDQGTFHEFIELVSYFMLAACVLGRSWCSLYIGGRKGRQVVAGGPYSVVRNPLYGFSFVGVMGIGLASGTLTLPVVLGVVFTLYYAIVVRQEERALAAKFGQDFIDYIKRVPRWIPDFNQWRDQPRADVDPRVVLRTMRDSAWFFVALPAFGLIDWLHAQSLLPIIFHLP